MSLAYLLLKCDDGAEKEILNKIRTISEVKETQETFGPFGAIVKIESENTSRIKHILNEKICCMSGINSSLTLMAPFEQNQDNQKPTWEEIRGLTWMFFEE